MNMTASIIVLFVCLAGFVGYRQLKQLRQVQASLPESLVTSERLLKLLTNLQQHRGMSTAWLSGDTSFLAPLRERQATIQAILPDLLRDARRESACPAPCFTLNEVQMFQFRWRTLVESLGDKVPEQSVAEHTHLVGKLLEWLAALGEARIEPVVGEERIGLARNYAHRLPALSESLGQARAIGSWVATRGACSPVARVRLIFLIGRAEALLDQAVKANDAGLTTRNARQAIREFAQTVRTNMLLAQGVSVDPHSYFQLATRAIDSVLAWVAENGRELQSSDQSAQAWLLNRPVT